VRNVRNKNSYLSRPLRGIFTPKRRDSDMMKMVALVSAIFLMLACDNELEINAPYKDITVVYSALDAQQDTNWVRIHKSYLGTEGISGGNSNPDSLYYTNLQVVLEELGNNGTVENTWLLQRDGMSFQMDSGFFTTEGFHLYRIDQLLSQDKSYRLIINKPDGEGAQVTATTPIVNNFNITEPKGLLPISFGKSGEVFAWSQARNARIYQGYIRLNYVEVANNNQSDSIRKYVDYNFPVSYGTSLNGGGQNIDVNISYETYYRFLFNSIGVNENVKRFFRGIDMIVFAGADELATFINVSQPAQGIVQDKPFYSNVENGAGIFSSRTSNAKLSIKLSGASLDSLVKGIYTCDLRFGRATAGDTCLCDPTAASGFRCD
jgi:hypothetical protein